MLQNYAKYRFYIFFILSIFVITVILLNHTKFSFLCFVGWSMVFVFNWLNRQNEKSLEITNSVLIALIKDYNIISKKLEKHEGIKDFKDLKK